jgi:type II secretory pathway predicted ATPase ExeA
MLLKKQVLFPATKKAFGLFRDPFADEAMQGADDVFTTPDIRYVREALFQTARHGGFLAVIGESGAGKSTLRRDLIERVNRENAPVIVIEPYIIAMEDNDVKGKTLKAAIAEAIISTIAPLESIKRSQDARFRQLHRVLKDSSRRVSATFW